MSLRYEAPKLALAALFTLAGVVTPYADAANGITAFKPGYPNKVNSPGGIMPGQIKIFGEHTLPTGPPAWSHHKSKAVVKNRAAGNVAMNVLLSELSGGLGNVGGNPPTVTEAVSSQSVGSYDVWLETEWQRWNSGVQETQTQQSATTTLTIS